jgi:hypothetical protein
MQHMFFNNNRHFPSSNLFKFQGTLIVKKREKKERTQKRVQLGKFFLRKPLLNLINFFGFDG